jgi:hypothetical protein
VGAKDLGVSASAIEALEIKEDRRPDDRTVILLGRALAGYGQELAGLALAEARRLLDERQIGSEQATANLKRVQAGLREPAAVPGQELSSAAVRRVRDRLRDREVPPPVRKDRGRDARGGSA